jgi:hypothetical protein
MPRATKQASDSSTDQGGGKRRCGFQGKTAPSTACPPNDKSPTTCNGLGRIRTKPPPHAFLTFLLPALFHLLRHPLALGVFTIRTKTKQGVRHISDILRDTLHAAAEDVGVPRLLLRCRLRGSDAAEDAGIEELRRRLTGSGPARPNPHIRPCRRRVLGPLDFLPRLRG